MILHVDMDAFYASIEEREDPELQGKAVVVGGTPTGRGVVSTANYEARKFGVHSAMAASRAKRLCPHAIFVRPQMGLYVEVSRQIREIFQRYTPEIEPLSLDEAFLDVSGCEKLFGSAIRIGREIQEAIAQELRLPASVGVAENKFLAKLASDLEKPRGFTVITPESMHEILDPLPVAKIWGIGKVTQRKFANVGVNTFGQLRMLTREQATQVFGNMGEHFWCLANGLDHRKVVSERKAKSISHETTFPEDVSDTEALESHLLNLTEQVGQRLRSMKRAGMTLTVKVRFSDFQTISRSQSFAEPTNSTDRLWEVSSKLLHAALPMSQLAVRLIGVGVSRFEKALPKQLELFESTGEAANSGVDATADLIRDKFGKSALLRASTLKTRRKRPDSQ